MSQIKNHNEQLEKLIRDVKRDLMFQVILNMRHFKLTQEDARYLAQDFLKIFPIQSEKELLDKLFQLGQKYIETRTVFIKYASSYYEKEKQRILQAIPPYLKNGDIEKALTIMKGGVIA